MIKKILGWIFVPYVMLGILVKRKTNKISMGILSGVGCFFALIIIVSLNGNNQTTDNKSVQVAKTEVSNTIIPTKKLDESPKSTPTPTPTPVPTPTLSPEEIKAQEYKKWKDAQFSAWDGSHIALVKLVKENMNDPKSFEHVETKFRDDGDGLTIVMKYRGKNAFGGLILTSVTAKADYANNTIQILSTN